MKTITNILFDLDGTLSDPAEGIVKAVLHALDRLNIEETDPGIIKSFIGPPIVGSFMQRYGMDEATALEAVQIYRGYYGDRGKFENQLYPGIDSLLATLKTRGFSIYLATAKPEGFALEILEHFSLSDYFTGFTGATLDHSRSEKDQVIAHLLQKYSLDPASCIMIGDRRYDIEGARSCGMPAIAVLYGHGSREELEASQPLHLAASVEELGEVLATYSPQSTPASRAR